MRTLLATAAALLLAFPALANEPSWEAIPELRADEGTRTVRELASTTRTLAFRIEDLGGRVDDLAVRETATGFLLALSADVLFDFDSAEIRPEAHEALGKAAAFLREHGKGTVRIGGHTDAKGSDAYNRQLSGRRANAVKAWLVREGKLPAVRFVTEGFGESKPIAPNTTPQGADDPEGRKRNRRVEITVKKG